MTKKTQGVEDLVRDVLATFHEPYREDVTLEVCQAIVHTPDWQRRYSLLEAELGHSVVNSWIGRYTKNLTGLNSIGQVKVQSPGLIESYTKLGS
jgi:hypothetical protein